MYYKSNIQARLLNHFCCEKPVSIKYYESVPLLP